MTDIQGSGRGSPCSLMRSSGSRPSNTGWLPLQFDAVKWEPPFEYGGSVSKVFVVLGMHRSATSLVSKALMSEIYMGQNPRPKVYESKRFRWLNQDILVRAGGDWDRPPSEQAIMGQYEHFKSRIVDVIGEESRGKDLWGWKDPRTTLTIGLYLPHLENPHFIAIFRNPLEVAKSLERRKSNSIPLRRGVRLANEYNARLLKFLSCDELNYRGLAGGLGSFPVDL